MRERGRKRGRETEAHTRTYLRGTFKNLSL